MLFNAALGESVVPMELDQYRGVIAWARTISSAYFDATREMQMASSALIGILITFLVVILVLYLVNMLPVDGRMKQIIRVIVIIIGVISMLKYLAVF